MKTIFIDTDEGHIGKQEERLIFRDYTHNEEKGINILDVNDIVILSRATITTPAINFLLERKILLHFIGKDGKYKGSIIPAFGKNINLRIKQYKVDDKTKIYLAKQFIIGKIKNQLTVLYRWQKNYGLNFEEHINMIKATKKGIENIDNLNELMGKEGYISRVYFECFKRLVPEKYGFSERNRRPPKDCVNALLSFAYTMFLVQFISSLFSSGLDPYYGYLHSNVYSRPALALDFLEEIRPIVDAFVLSLVRGEIIKKEDFEIIAVCKKSEVNINKKG